ncbi:hypothetical protein DXG01_011137, partial [Tephrocybe rancida]
YVELVVVNELNNIVKRSCYARNFELVVDDDELNHIVQRCCCVRNFELVVDDDELNYIVSTRQGSIDGALEHHRIVATFATVVGCVRGPAAATVWH